MRKKLFAFFNCITLLLFVGPGWADNSANHKGKKALKYKIQHTVTAAIEGCEFSGETSFTIQFPKKKQIADSQQFVVSIMSENEMYDVARVPFEEGIKKYPVTFLAGDCATNVIVTLI